MACLFPWNKISEFGERERGYCAEKQGGNPFSDKKMDCKYEKELNEEKGFYKTKVLTRRMAMKKNPQRKSNKLLTTSTT